MRVNRKIFATAPDPSPKEFRIVCEAAELELIDAGPEIQAAEHREDETSPVKKKLKRFKMLAYSGGLLRLEGFFDPVVIDLQGMSAPSQTRPILRDHDQSRIVGHSDQIEIGARKINVAGVISGVGEDAAEVLATAANGFPWGSSVGASAQSMEHVQSGQSVIVNGRKFNGPINVARRSTLGEVSFVAIGADLGASASVAATRPNKGGSVMTFEKWLEAKGISADSLDEATAVILKASWKSETEVKPPADPETPPADPKPIEAAAAATATGVGVGTTGQAGDGVDPVADMRAKYGDDLKRIAAIGAIENIGDHPEIQAKAVEEGWNIDRAGLEVLRASRPEGPAIHNTSGGPQEAAVLEAALCNTCGINDKLMAKSYTQEVLDKATAPAMRAIGIHEIMHATIRAAGKHFPAGRVNNDFIRTAFEADRQMKGQASTTLQASGIAFSTISLSGILGNTANKALLESFSAVNVVAPLISRARSVKDFKQHTNFRLTAAGKLEKIGADGELKHTKFSEEPFTNQVDTFGRIVGLTRQTIINDDLGAFLQLPQLLGRQGALARESALFTVLLGNAGPFYSVANANLLTGAGSVLSITSLGDLEQKFDDQVDSEGEPVLLQAVTLLVPTSLKTLANTIFVSEFVNEDGTGSKPKPARNIFQAKFEVVFSTYLNSQALSGSSATAFYLFANTQDVASLEIAYLNGVQTPFLESTETDFDTLGMLWRSFYDFGVALQDHRGSAKSNGV